MLLERVQVFVDTYFCKKCLPSSSIIYSFVTIGSFLFFLFILYQIVRFIKCICCIAKVIYSPVLLSASREELEAMLWRMGNGDRCY